MSATYKYTKDGDPVYIAINEDSTLRSIRGADVGLTQAEVIVDLVQRLTAVEMSARVIANQRKEIDDALAIINDEATKLEHNL